MSDGLVTRLRELDRLHSYADKCEAASRIEKLEAALRKLAVITDCDIEGKHPVDTKLTWARQKLFDARQIANKALNAE